MPPHAWRERVSYSPPTFTCVTIKFTLGQQEDNKEKWEELYRFAAIELENAKMAGRIGDARGPIVEHIEKLKRMPGLEDDELQAIDEALSRLKESKQQEADAPRIAEAALQKLHVIAPKLQNPKI